MFYKFKQRCLLLLVFVIVGLSISLSFNSYSSLQATATSVDIVDTKNATVLEAEAKHFYSIAQFQKAIDLWQQAAKIYANRDFLDRARVLSNIALAHSQLGNHSEAREIIADSLNLIDKPQTSNKSHIRVLAQVLNNQGIIQLREANTAAAIATWEQAKANYQQTGDELGVIRASINQSSAYKELGFYRRAYKTSSEVEESLTQQPDSILKVSGLRSYGDILHLVGQQERSRQVLEQSLALASRLDSSVESGKILLSLGGTYRAIEPAKALELYDRALKTCQQQCLETDLPLQIYLAKLNLLSDIPPEQYVDLIRAIKAEFARLPINRANIDRQINFAYSLIQLAYPPNANEIANVLDKTEITQLIEKIIEQAKAINYPKARSYALGLRGKIAEEQENWLDAREYTEKALLLSQRLNIPETSYLWQWQIGRIDRALGETQLAIADYFQAVELLRFLSKDIAAIDPQVQYSFRDGVEPVYRELVSLLLIEQEGTDNLERAREVMESLQQAELNNFFREACLDAQTVEIDNLDPQAAIIYPIILSDRLEVIVSLPDRPLKHYTTKISQQELEVIIAKLRYNIVVRSRRNFYRPAQKLYELLISPISEDLVRDGIKTLVFVPDGAFRNVPFSALYDGDRYLIENYSIALTPGLQLLAPRPLTEEKLHTVAAGLTKSMAGFSALNYVKAELEQIEKAVDSVILLDREFTPESLKQEIESSDYPIVHIATHGQFSSSMEDTFLLAWNDRININELDRILQTRNFSSENAIELLVLSACETATGDNRAALGLAGMAVRAGAKSTLATLWAVNDRATAKLMSNFYRQLSDKHLPKAEAVRQAQLFLLQDDKYKHPFYWAPYVLLGNWL